MTTLRKSFRRVVALSPGLRVRMRTLLLPQLLPSSTLEDDENEGEKKIVLCVEVENPEMESQGLSFEVESVNVEIGGKGGQATAELVCQPEQQLGNPVFPLRLGAVEQYNLLYGVSIASAPEERNSGTGVDDAVLRSMGRGDDTRPAAITLIGRPFRRLLPDTDEMDEHEGEIEYPTSPISSRWNCQLDLTAFHASLSLVNANPAHNTATTSSNRLSKSALAPPAPQSNAVAGDKRYSLAAILSQNSGTNASINHRDSRRVTGPGIGPRPIMPSQAMTTQNGGRMTSIRQPPVSEGLLISVKLLPTTTTPNTGISPSDTQNRGDQSVRPFEPFSIEVFVHNRTEEVRRFRLAVPQREGEGQIREMIDKRKSQQMTQDDPCKQLSQAKSGRGLFTHLTITKQGVLANMICPSTSQIVD